MSNNPVSSTDPDGGWDGDWEYGMGPGLYLSSSQQNNPDAFAHSEFDNNYNQGGPLGGNINADGSYTSNNTWIAGSHANWKKRQNEDYFETTIGVDKNGDVTSYSNALITGYMSDVIYDRIAEKGASKDKEGGLSKFLGESIFGKVGYGAVKKHAGDNNPYMYSYDEMQDQATEVAWAASNFVPASEIFQLSKYGGQAFKWLMTTKLSGSLNLSFFQKHHIIPNAIYKKFAAQLKNIGWVQNASLNLKKIPIPFHGNHPAYNAFVESKMTDMIRKGGITIEGMNALQQEMRILVGDAYRTGVGNLNDYFKFIGF